MQHFPLHIGDFTKKTSFLPLEDVGAYLRLMMRYYDSEEALPNDPAELAFTINARTPREVQVVKRVLARFFSLSEVPVHGAEGTEKRFVQKRIEEVLASYRESGVQSRYANLCRHWEKINPGVPKPDYDTFSVNPDSWFDGTTNRVRKVTGRNHLVLVSDSPDCPALPPPQSQPETNNQEPITSTPIVPKGTPTIEDLAEAIYALYPRKQGKTKAIAAIVKVLRAGTHTELELQAIVKAYAEATSKWSEQDRTFIPHPATWFNRGSYMDDPATWTRQPSQAEKKGRGAGGPVESAPLFAMGSTTALDAPEGWEKAMDALYGPDWRERHASYALLLPADQRQVRAWLVKNAQKKEGGRA